MSVRPSVRP